MEKIKNILNEPAILLLIVIVVICLCIVTAGIFILYRLENEKRVTKAALELKKITNSIRAGLVHLILEDNYKILYASDGFYDILSYKKKEAKAQNMNSLLDFIIPEDAGIVEAIKEQLKEDSIHCEIRMAAKDGNVIRMLMNGTSSIGRDGKHTLSVVFVDITEQKRMQEMLLMESERYRIATELFNDVIFDYSSRSDAMKFTDRYMDLFGIGPNILDFTKCYAKRRDLIYPDDWGIYLELCHQLFEGKSAIEAQFRIKNRLGEFIWCQIMGKTIYDDNRMPVRVIGKVVNVDYQKKELEALEYKATRDPLTGIYNKEVTMKKIEKFISGSKDRRHMLMLIDFDDFKSINDHYGHLMGDKVLTYVIGLVKDIFTEGEIIGRIGGDEFVVFAGNIDNDSVIDKKAELLKNKLDTVYVNESNRIQISASIGVAVYPEAGLHYEQLMEQADQALYRVKEHGKNNYMIYHSPI